MEERKEGLTNSVAGKIRRVINTGSLDVIINYQKRRELSETPVDKNLEDKRLKIRAGN